MECESGSVFFLDGAEDEQAEDAYHYGAEASGQHDEHAFGIGFFVGYYGLVDRIFVAHLEVAVHIDLRASCLQVGQLLAFVAYELGAP